jgi:hypothetical protein
VRLVLSKFDKGVLKEPLSVDKLPLHDRLLLQVHLQQVQHQLIVLLRFSWLSLSDRILREKYSQEENERGLNKFV